MASLRITLLFVILGVTMLYGGYQFFRGVRKVRAPRAYKDALFAWSEPPSLGFKHDLPGWLGITLHRLAIVVIGLIAMLTVLFHPAQGLILPGFSGPAESFSELILDGAVALLGFLCGFSLFGPIGERLGGNHNYSVSEEGLIVAQQVILWNAFSGFEVDASRNAIFIWSASLPGTPGMTAAPSSPDQLQELSRILQRYLPASDPFPPSLLRRYAFPGLMACLSLPFIAAACALFLAPSGLALLIDTLMAWVLIVLGGTLISSLIYGGKMKRAPTA